MMKSTYQIGQNPKSTVTVTVHAGGQYYAEAKYYGEHRISSGELPVIKEWLKGFPPLKLISGQNVLELRQP